MGKLWKKRLLEINSAGTELFKNSNKTWGKCCISEDCTKWEKEPYAKQDKRTHTHKS